MFNFKKINEIFDKQKTIFSQIDELNQLLKEILPNHLICSSHIGAIDYRKNTVVLFVNSSEVLHLIKFHSNSILDYFQKHHYNFNNLLIKISSQQINNSTKSTKPNKLIKL